MVTYQDFLEVKEDDKRKRDFIHTAISAYKNSEMYETAVLADEYYAMKNHTIVAYQKLLYTIEGKAIPDTWSANFKMASGFFKRFIMQEVQYLLGNGITWNDEATETKLGEDFDVKVKEAAHYALCGGVSYGFWNNDHLEYFKATEFVPLYDEEDGALKAGIRFWQINTAKPMRATLYEEDGFTDYLWGVASADGEEMHPKSAYHKVVSVSDADGIQIYDGENYPTFPIIPFWGNKSHQSELVGIQEQIDCFDLIKSGFANSVDEGSLIYWLVQNAGGMDDVDLVKFVERVKTMHAASVGDGQTAEPHTIEPPYQSRETLLERLRMDLYEDAMALDTKALTGGQLTATAIRAAYENLNEKADDFEDCVKDFLRDILLNAGVDDAPTFTRSVLVNKSEEVQLVLASAQYFDDEYTTTKLLTLLGDADKVDEVLDRKAEEEIATLKGLVNESSGQGNRETPSGNGEENSEGVQASD